jgi:hypothetical protein
MSRYQLAQINVARARGPMDSETMAGFVARLEDINALADGSPGFVWRLQTPDGDATALRVFEDNMVIVNMSVWESIDALRDYVYRSGHVEVMRRRKEWFERFDGMYMALWWVPRGHIPTVEDAKVRLDYIRTHGPTEFAFTFTQAFLPPDASAIEIDELLSERDTCPA